MRLLHVITGLETGGAEMALCRLVETLRPPLYTHTVVSLSDGGALGTRLEKSASLAQVGMRAGRIRARDAVCLRVLLRKEQPDLIHSWMYHANLMATIAGIGLRTPRVWAIRQALYDMKAEKLSTRAVIRASALLSRHADRIVYNSSVSATQHERLGYRAEHTCVIPNGFDTTAFQPDEARRERVRAELGIESDSLAIGMIARVHPMKDHPNFLTAAARFAQSHPKAVFVLAGDGTQEGKSPLREQIEHLGLQNVVRLCGRREDVAALNAALDIATLSSKTEAFPNAIGEAMACGVPCVATDVGDVREILADTGIVVARNDPTALSDGWAALAELAAGERRQLGLHARQRIVEGYSLRFVAGEYANLYAAITEGRGLCAA